MDLLTALSCAAPQPTSGSRCSDSQTGGDGFVAALATVLESVGHRAADEDEAALAELAELAGRREGDGTATVATWPLSLLLDAAKALTEVDEEPTATVRAALLDEAEPEQGMGTPLQVEPSPDHTDADTADVHPGTTDVGAATTAGSDEPRTEHTAEPGRHPDRVLPAARQLPVIDRPTLAQAADSDAPGRESDVGSRRGARVGDGVPDVPDVVPRTATRTDAGTPADPLDDVRLAEPAPAPNAAAPSGATGDSPRTLAIADGVRRVLEAVELLEKAPPPRQFTIDVGEARLRVALEDGNVRLSVLGATSDDLDELVAAAQTALSEHGFDLGGDRRGDDQPGDDHVSSPSAGSEGRRTRTTDRGLRL